MTKTNIMLTPLYMKKFSCIGSECEDTCCSGWTVLIDQEVYKKYKKIQDREFKNDFNKSIKRIKSGKFEGSHKIVLKKDCTCPFLNEEKLCKIQLSFGEDYLSNVCNNFPRINNIVDGNLEQSGSMSCPEVARLALLDTARMEFEQLDSINNTKLIDRKISTVVSDNDKIKQYFWPLRIFSIEILQNREYSIYDRLIILGLFYENISNIIKVKNYENIPNIINTFKLLLVEKGQIQKELSNIQIHITEKYKIIRDIILPKDTDVNSDRFLECLNEAMEYFEGNQESATNIKENYLQAYQKFFSPYMKNEQHIFENYLVNSVFSSLFPLDSKDLYDSYMMLVIRFSMVKVILIGMAGYKQNLTTEHTIKLIQSFSKTLEHNERYMGKILEYFKKHNITSLTYMATLLKG